MTTEIARILHMVETQTAANTVADAWDNLTAEQRKGLRHLFPELTVALDTLDAVTEERIDA